MAIQYSGGWEARDERNICRWFVAYSEIEEGEIAGIIGGYSGGGGFIEERFFARTDGNYFKDLFIDFTDLAHPFDSFLVRKVEDLSEIPMEMVRNKSSLLTHPIQWVGHCYPPGPGSSGGRFSSP